MAKIVGYIAASLDGFIADEDGNLDWLFKYGDADLGEHDYRSFIKSKSDEPWAYGDQRCIVVTSRPIGNPKGPLEIRHDVDALIAELRALDDGDVWMLGGGQLQMAFLERGALDEIEIYVMPELIGGGMPLFPPTGFKASPVLLSAKTLDRGCVRLHYAFRE